jgi:hypothetical protein
MLIHGRIHIGTVGIIIMRARASALHFLSAPRGIIRPYIVRGIIGGIGIARFTQIITTDTTPIIMAGIITGMAALDIILV